ncbi:putative bifunctional diguanylate cyclase/phosphodiesterase [Yoonia sp. 2307UL14-13]|uniref:putative bifunctional diguanylate cyclase/phosphodiesterase n=1 Tax=Yoonia sp. 2307UL14-13 TaxID=3126506 RepID=UPI0030A16056
MSAMLPLGIACSCAVLAVAYGIYLRDGLRRADAARRQAENLLALERQEAEFHRISSENADTGLLIQELDGCVRWVNDAYLRITRRKAEDVIGNDPMRFAFAPDSQPTEEEIENFCFDPDNFADETNVIRENIRGDGTPVWLHINTSFYTRRTGETLAILACRDVTENIAQEQALQASTAKLAYAAEHDELTGAGSRGKLATFLDQTLAASHDSGTHVGVLQIDLDKFKQTNDTHGHAAGDAVLKAVVKRMRRKLRESDLIARSGGDEFVVVCPDLRGMTDLKKIATALQGAANHPVVWGNVRLDCQISVGAALSGPDVLTADDMLARSDFALYEVKRSGRGRVATYSPALHRRHTRTTQMAADLRQAITDDALMFHYQPVVGTAPGDVRGFETLVRWDHPEQSLIPPRDFLPFAQSLGLMAELDFMAMNAAMDLKQRMNALGFGAQRMSFNTSPEVLSHPEFMARFTDGLAARGLSPPDVIVEVLETVVFGHCAGTKHHEQTIQDLDAAGITAVLDDFGSGHAGLAHLAKLPIKGVKVDHSLTRDLLTDPTTDKIIGTLIALCNDLGLRVAAEGVECAAQAERLDALGTSSIQGYWIARPMPEDEALIWLAANTDCPAQPVPLTKGKRIA